MHHKKKNISQNLTYCKVMFKYHKNNLCIVYLLLLHISVGNNKQYYILIIACIYKYP